MKKTLLTLTIITSIHSNECKAKDYSNSNWTTFGETSSTCPQFISGLDNKNVEFLYISSANGMITGLNAMAGIENNYDSSVGSKTTYQYREKWLRDYCMNNPNMTYSMAVVMLFSFMKSKGV